MNTALGAVSALGGIVVFTGGVWAIVRGIIRQTDATRENTTATRELSKRLDGLAVTVSQHDRDIAFLKGRRTR